MATVRKRVGKRVVSWQIDYFEPVPTERHFSDELEASGHLMRLEGRIGVPVLSL
jgi:hypothetical protein